mmetsp:Transcript_43948/g.138133  ORF Transcript_43948/g.138133 Transcript_43948/m.138133 type:complete len:233 (-) Transcript_43948:532-1230(-)
MEGLIRLSTRLGAAAVIGGIGVNTCLFDVPGGYRAVRFSAFANPCISPASPKLHVRCRPWVARGRWRRRWRLPALTKSFSPSTYAGGLRSLSGCHEEDVQGGHAPDDPVPAGSRCHGRAHDAARDQLRYWYEGPADGEHLAARALAAPGGRAAGDLPPARRGFQRPRAAVARQRGAQGRGGPVQRRGAAVEARGHLQADPRHAHGARQEFQPHPRRRGHHAPDLRPGVHQGH